MKKFIIILAFTLFFVSAGFSVEQINDPCFSEKHLLVKNDYFYIKAFGGANYEVIDDANWNSQKGYLLSGALGYYYQHGLHIEAEYAFRKNYFKYHTYYRSSNYLGSAQRLNIGNSSCMLNALWDIPILQNSTYTCFQPFFGFGLGIDFYYIRSKYFAWQFIAGIKRPINNEISISLEYIVRRDNQSVGLGLIYKFGS